MTGASEASKPQDGFRLAALDVPVRIRINPRARRLILRTDAATGEIVLILPSARERKRGLAFAEANIDWIRRQAVRAPETVEFAEGAQIPLLGKPHRIRHVPEQRSLVAVEADEIRVAGRAQDLARRVHGWLRVEARRLLVDKTRDAARALGVTPAAVTIRDTKSRWGSCSASGRLSYSWRLVLAPEPVVGYVVTHEVAHLRELNHGPAFWRIVERLCPDHREHRKWLREHGASLHRYG